jgi:hypothetical protein
MNASTQAALEPKPLDPVFGLRDDLAQTLTPANAYERMLLTAVAQAWFRFQQAQQIERRVFEKTDPLELVSNNLETFKAVTRHVSNCERAWRQAIAELKRTQRARAKATLASPNARRAADRPMPPPPVPTPEPLAPPAAAPLHPHRE